MKNIRIFYLLFLFVHPSNIEASVTKFQKNLDSIFKKGIPASMKVSAQIISLTRGDTLYELNSGLSLNPASTIKLLTAQTALSKLGVDYKYPTEIYASGPIRDGVLQGNLILKGSGDPSLVSERLYLIALAIRQSGISRITGQIQTDSSAFDSAIFSEFRDDYDQARAYNAPVSGVNLNYNSATLYSTPAKTAGAKPLIEIELDSGYLKLSNHASTTRPGGVYDLCLDRRTSPEGDEVIFTGHVPIGTSRQHHYVSITKPDLYTAKALCKMLGDAGISVNCARVSSVLTPDSAKKITSQDSFPLRDIVILMNKFSNNFIADSLVKTIAREISQKQGSTTEGVKLIKSFAPRFGINTTGLEMVSGSGLTNQNRISAAQFIDLLRFSYQNFDLFPELMSSIPIGGVDGTLKKRIREGSPSFGKIRGKTGSIDGVASLVGIAHAQEGEILAFAFILNDPGKGLSLGKYLDQDFAEILAGFDREGS